MNQSRSRCRSRHRSRYQGYRHSLSIAAGLFLIVVFSFSGCSRVGGLIETDASTGSTGSTGSTSERLALWQMHRARLAGIHEWQLKGRMAVRTSFRSGTATVVWNRATSADELDLFGPFGSGHVRISSKSDGAVMTDAKKVVKRAASLRELLYSEAGWPVPFDSLKYWLIGAPVPQIRAEWRIDENGRLAWLRQAGWYISFDDYRDRAGIQIPRRIRMEALPGTASLTFPDGRISDELVVKLVISELATASIPGHGNFSRTSQD